MSLLWKTQSPKKGSIQEATQPSSKPECEPRDFLAGFENSVREVTLFLVSLILLSFHRLDPKPWPLTNPKELDG